MILYSSTMFDFCLIDIARLKSDANILTFICVIIFITIIITSSSSLIPRIRIFIQKYVVAFLFFCFFVVFFMAVPSDWWTDMILFSNH